LRTNSPAQSESDPSASPGRGWNLQPLINIITFERISKSGKHWEEALALYCFYTRLVQKRESKTVRSTVHFCANGLDWPAAKITRARKTLLELGLIEDKKLYGPGKGGVRKWLVLIHYVPKDTEEAYPPENHRGMDSRGENISPDLELEVEPKSLSPRSSRGGIDRGKVPSSSVPDEWLPLAQRLARIIQSRKNVRTTGRQLSSWAKEFSRLGREAGVERDRMLDALAWYRQHAGEPYVPVIESGTAFREKFLKLEAAVERAKNPVNGANGPARKQNGYATPPQTQELQNEKALRSLGKLIEIHPSDLPRLDPYWQPLLASLGVGTSRFLELFAAWLDSSKQGFGGDWLRKAGQLKPGHLDPEGQTMRTFRRYVKWTTGEEEYS
jgi:hypothetical protein